MPFLSGFTRNRNKVRVYGLLVIASLLLLALGYQLEHWGFNSLYFWELKKPLLAYQGLKISWTPHGAEFDPAPAKVGAETQVKEGIAQQPNGVRAT